MRVGGGNDGTARKGLRSRMRTGSRVRSAGDRLVLQMGMS